MRMSFLDNLENNLKALEGREERDGEAGRRRDEERAQALAEAPWAERLKKSGYAEQLLAEAAREAHKLRAKLYIAWLGNTLRLEIRTFKLDLKPTAEGIVAVITDGAREVERRPVALEEAPGKLMQQWTAVMGAGGAHHLHSISRESESV